MEKETLEKTAFVISIAVFAFLYGVASASFGWFPNSFVQLAWNQAESLVGQLTSSAPRWTTQRVFDRAGVRIVERDQLQGGFTLVASHWDSFDWKPGLKLIDHEGDVVHEWSVDPKRLFDDSADRRPGRDIEFGHRHVHGFHLYPDGDVLLNVEYAGTVRLSACDSVIWRTPAGSHHSIAIADDGSLWIPGSTGLRRSRIEAYPNGYPGLRDSLYHDLLLHLSRDGQVLESIGVLDVLYENRLERHIRKASLADGRDVAHVNDVEPLPSSLAAAYPMFDAGDLLVSARNLDLLFVFDPETRTVKWHSSHATIQQHDPDFLPGGWIGVFDNNRDGTRRGRMLGGSRIVAIQPHTDSVRVLYEASDRDRFYTSIMGNWQKLRNGNLLVTESLPGRIREVSPSGDVVWEWIRPGYDRTRTPWVTGSKRYSLESETVASWPCSPGDAGDSGA